MMNSIRNVTAEGVRESTLNAGISKIDHYECLSCGEPDYFSIQDGELWYHSTCFCIFSQIKCGWQDAANWINMQDDEWKSKIAARFGLDLKEKEKNMSNEQLKCEECGKTVEFMHPQEGEEG